MAAGKRKVMIVLSLILLIVYIYFFVWFSPPGPLRAPPSASGDPPPPPPRVEIRDGQVELGDKQWSFRAPRDYTFDPRHRLVPANSCTGKPDNEYVPAMGEELFEYSRLAKLRPDQVSTNERTDNVFYFQCFGGHIRDLYRCANGTFFDQSKDECNVVGSCANKPDGHAFPALRLGGFYECQNETLVEKQCPPEQIFDQYRCRQPDDPCVFKPDGFLVGAAAGPDFLEECAGGVTRKRYCDFGEYVVGGKCQRTRCHGLADGVHHLPTTRGVFTYSDELLECAGEREVRYLSCRDKPWHPNERTYNLSEIPNQVLDKHGRCEAPALCSSVQTDAVVENNSFRRQRLPDIYDKLFGYRCSPNLHAVPSQPGMIIRDHRVEACREGFLPIPGVPGSYYDCEQKQQLDCPTQEAFDVVTQSCRPYDNFFFKYRHVPFFRMQPLTEYNWFVGRDPLDPALKVDCSDDQVRLPNYNVCSDPECAKYPFLSQLKGAKIYANEQYACDSDMKKYPYELPQGLNFDYWFQQFKSSKPVVCMPGKTIRSGHFVLDSVIRMTCDPDRPFVLCPSSWTSVVNTHTCIPKDQVWNEKLDRGSFYLSELDSFDFHGHTVEFYGEKSGITWTPRSLPAQPVQANYFANTFLPGEKIVYRAAKPVHVSRLRISANDPRYYIENRIFQRNGDLNYNRVDPSKPLTEEVAMETYSVHYLRGEEGTLE